MIRDEDREIVDRMVTLEHLMNALEGDARLVTKSPFKIPEVYENLFDHFMEYVRKDMVALRAVMRKEQVKILSVKPDHDGEYIQYDYIAKGYHSYARYWRYALDMKATKAFRKYL